MSKIMIIKNSNQIIVSQNGKKLVISKDEELYSKLSDLSKTEIERWFLEGRWKNE